MRKILALGFAALALVVLYPAITNAQDLTTILDALPDRWYGPAFAAYLFAFYILGPIAKRVGRNADGSRTKVGALGEWITQDSHRPPPMKLLVLVAALSLPGLAAAQSVPSSAEPAFGGSVLTERFGLVVAGPSAALGVASLDKDGNLTTGLRLAPGYGVSAWSDRWYTVGLSGALLIDASSDETPARAAIMLSFAKYLRIGYGYGGRVLFALGVGP